MYWYRQLFYLSNLPIPSKPWNLCSMNHNSIVVNLKCYFFVVGGLSWSMVSYSETCLNRTSLGPTLVFWIDRCLVYTGLNNKKKKNPTLGLYLKFGLYRIPVYWGFGLDRLHCITKEENWTRHYALCACYTIGLVTKVRNWPDFC